MKIQTNSDNSVERSGLAANKAFTINFNAKMAKMLADGIYSDKIQSIIRELSCNAYDSHVEAGCADKPIEIHLPTHFEPWFHVKDFGVGMDHDQIMNVYTCYGESTKTNSNDFIGQLGLGSKSPISYVDAFDVNTVKNGMLRQYSMYKDEFGMPNVALLGESPTDEPNGVTVKMPVKSADYTKFKEKAVLALQWFPVKPKIVGVSNFEFKTIEYAYSGASWKIRKKAATYWNESGSVNKPVALMGLVGYPLDAESISDLTSAQRALLNLPLVINFNIGDLEIAASREALGYDTRTQTSIKNHLNSVLDELRTSFETEIKNAKTEWEARKIFGNIFGSGSFRSEFESAFKNIGLKWKNIDIKSNHVDIDTNKIYSGTYPNLSVASVRGYGSRKRPRSVSYHSEKYLIRCEDDAVIIYDDLDKGGSARVNYLIEKLVKTGKTSEIYYFSKDDCLVTLSQLKAMLGNPEITLTSSLEKRPSTATGAKVYWLRYNGNADANSKYAWDTVSDVDFEDGGYYVTLDRFDVLDADDKTTSRDLAESITWAKAAGVLKQNENIYVPRAHFKKKVKESDDWVNVWTAIANGLVTKLTPSATQKVADMLHYESAVSKIRDQNIWKTKWNLEHPSNSIFNTFIKEMNVLHDVANSPSAAKDKKLIEIARMFGKAIDLPKPSVDVIKLYGLVLEEYPMMKFVIADKYSHRYIHGQADIENITKYVNTIDSYKMMTLIKNNNVNIVP